MSRTLRHDTQGVSASRSRVTALHAGWIVLICALLLSLIGIHGMNIARPPSGDAALGLVAGRQTVFLGIGLVAAIGACAPSYRMLVPLAWSIMAVVLGLLVFVLLPIVPEAIVTPRNGARRWINVGITDFQPSELAKIAYVLVTASYLRYRSNYRTLAGLIPPALITLIPMGLILIEPDLGTALLFIPTLVAMLIAAGAKLWHLIGTAALGGGFAMTVVVVSLVMAQEERYPILRPHQVERIQAVVDRIKGDERHLDDRGFQGEQALMLIGSGRIMGHSTEKSTALVRYSRLPEGHNDMIFAVLINRFGLAGAWSIIGLYMVMMGAALAVASTCKDPFGRLVVVGLVAMIVTQATINMSMNLGLLPITGMTLPFVSAGGSSLVTGFVMVGLVCNVAMRRPRYFERRSFEYDVIDDER